jgi:hypothetical protein
MLANIKNSLLATHRAVGAKHLPRYLGAFAWRFNRRFVLKTPILSHFPSGNACARTREGTSSASMWTGTRVPRNTGFPLMILPFNRSLVGARVEPGRFTQAR